MSNNKNWKEIFRLGSKAYNFLELANPDENGISEEISVTLFTGKYENLKFGNGADWARGSSQFRRVFNVDFIKSNDVGSPTIALKLNGYKNEVDNRTQNIRGDIKREIYKLNCVVLGTRRSSDHKVEVDHKDGRKQDLRIMNTATQKLEDFQSLSKPANDAKRQFCKECTQTNKRYDAKLLGYTVSFTFGTINYENEIGCKGCYWYDPVAFRQTLFMK